MDNTFYVDACYYSEQWPRDRWKTEAKMMQEIGFNDVRMGAYV
jgi:beta-galactosidase